MLEKEFLYGRQAVREALRAGRRRPFRLLLAETPRTTEILDEIITTAKQRHIPVHTLPRPELDRVTTTPEHQGVALEVSAYPYTDTETMLNQARTRAEKPLLLLLDLIQDVLNLGSLIRTAEAAGVHGVILQERRAAGISPATVNTASGATEHLNIACVTNLAREMEILKEQGIWMVGLEGVPEAQPYTAIDMAVPLGIVVGSEGSGLRRLVRERCDWLAAIPMRGAVSSLNAAVAGSLALYEAVRQRQAVHPAR
ncbi:MAG: 23S rRNA (guanosine(2251)-2'-O)-methyltransferase RlmB [Anaerolineae bacterium]|nr:23S rRNA (guanosine(2251)-2'-O)-methyltransferase RlmB [Anaerolineae bacterium]